MVRFNTEGHSNGSLVGAKMMPSPTLQRTCASSAA